MVSKGFLLFSCFLATVTGFAVSSPHRGPYIYDPTHEWKTTTIEEQLYPEGLKEITTTVAEVILKQKMSDTNPLGRECKLEFVSVENFKHLFFHKMEVVPFSSEMNQINSETHHKFDATFKWTQCGTLNGRHSTCKNMRVVQSIDMLYTPTHEDEIFCTL